MNFLTPYLFWIKFAAIIALVVGLFGSGYHIGVKHESDKIAKNVIITQAAVVVADRKTTEAVSAVAVDYTNILKTQKEGYDNEMLVLKKKLARMPVCTVSADIVRLLDANSSSNLPLSSATGQQLGISAETADSTCSAELETAARNYREVCIPNADQLEAVQKAYNAVKENINNFKVK